MEHEHLTKQRKAKDGKEEMDSLFYFDELLRSCHRFIPLNTNSFYQYGHTKWRYAQISLKDLKNGLGPALTVRSTLMSLCLYSSAQFFEYIWRLKNWIRGSIDVNKPIKLWEKYSLYQFWSETKNSSNHILQSYRDVKKCRFVRITHHI